MLGLGMVAIEMSLVFLLGRSRDCSHDHLAHSRGDHGAPHRVTIGMFGGACGCKGEAILGGAGATGRRLGGGGCVVAVRSREGLDEAGAAEGDGGGGWRSVPDIAVRGCAA